MSAFYDNSGDAIDGIPDWSSPDLFPPVQPQWAPAAQGTSPWDNLDFQVDLGCGTLKKGRIGIDRYFAPGATNVVMDLDSTSVHLPFRDNSINNIISHHFFEHVGEGFIALVDECYRVLVPGGVLRAITPLFPSWAAVSDPDHCRYFMADEDGGPGTWEAFVGSPEHHSYESFSVPYMKSRFERVDQDMTPRVEPHLAWTPVDARELRVALRKRAS